MTQPRYDDIYVQALFDRMGRTYDLVNLVSSFGFSAFWRRQCVANLPITPGACVCDMMAGTGECWSHILRRGADTVISIDFSRVMTERQKRRRLSKGLPIDVRCENAVATSIPPESVDFVVSAFGLKTLGDVGLVRFGREIRRILKPNGHFSLLESLAEHIAQIILKDFNAPWVKVSVAKLQAIRNCKLVGISIERGQIQ